MKENELVAIKQDYERLIKTRDEFNNMKKRIKELEKIKEVQEYINLSKKYEFALENSFYNNLDKKSDEELLDLSFHINKITPTTNIYFYIASYKFNGQGAIERVDKNSKDMDYVSFINIESLKDTIRVNSTDLEEFIDNNIIIYPPSINDSFFSSFYFKKIQKDYFETLITDGQEKAVSKCKKYSKDCNSLF